MPRIIVLADGRYGQTEDYERIVFDEGVTCALLHDHHAAAQIIERMAWALADTEGTDPERLQKRRPQERLRATTPA